MLAYRLREEPLKLYRSALAVEMGLQIFVDFSREHWIEERLPVLLNHKLIEWLDQAVGNCSQFRCPLVKDERLSPAQMLWDV